MSKVTVHMIGQAHLDPVWLWRWTEGRAEALATSQSAVDRLAEYPDFEFARGESQVYEWIESEDPQLFAQIVDLIEQGRWHVVNGMVIQPDMNQPQGESFVRQFLLGKAYMQEHLGVEPRIAYCVDSFGHAGTLPQIMKKCGMDRYVFMRPGPHEMELPSEVFWWEAPDGSRVLAHRISGAYSSDSEDYRQFIELSVDAKPAQLNDTMCFFGVGNHGGGPTKAQIENVQGIAHERHEDLDIRFSNPDEYFAAIFPDACSLPVVDEELYFHATGCYSANSQLKRSHRRAECDLLVAERMLTMAQLWADQPSQIERLRALWHTLCFNEFHDTLGGCSIKKAENEAIMDFGRICAEAREITNTAGRAIAARVNNAGPGSTVVVFNPFPNPSTQYVEYEPWTDRQPWEACDWGLTDEEEQAVAHQILEPQAATGTLNRLVFSAELPPLGYRTYRFAPDLPRADVDTVVRVSTTTLENDCLTLRMDPSTGHIVSCVDRATGLELTGPDAWNVAQVIEDKSDTWSHGVSRFDEASANLLGLFGNAHITVCDEGPIQVSLLVERAYEGSTWLQQIVLRAGQREILIRNWLHWQGQWRMIKLAFDVAVGDPHAYHDVPFGWCERACDGSEVPTQMWMDVTGTAYNSPGHLVGLALIDDGKYSCDVSGSTMRLTILRCPPYGYHMPHELGSKCRYDWIDQGLQEFTLVLVPHNGDWRDAGVVQRAREVNLPPVPITMHCHAGELARVGSLATLTSDEMELTALKPAEDGNGTIVRIADRHGRGGSGELIWQSERFPITVAPFEVITLRLVDHTATLCDMLERPQ